MRTKDIILGVSWGGAAIAIAVARVSLCSDKNNSNFPVFDLIFACLMAWWISEEFRNIHSKPVSM